MNTKQLNRIKHDKGFIAALDQSGGSTPKALALYGVNENSYNSEEEMYNLVHQMRTRIITSPAFSSKHILAAILFKHTMRSQIEGIDTADHLWGKKNIVPILKVDNGLDEQADGVQLMKPIPELNNLLDEAISKNIFGTKMRSVIKENNSEGIKKVVDQQFEIARQICATGLVPIIEPEVDINASEKSNIEQLLLEYLKDGLKNLNDNELVMLKLTIPDVDNIYRPLMAHPNVVRVAALSGGYERQDANERLASNNGLIASFSRALTEGLSAKQSDDEFNQTLSDSVKEIYKASIT